MNVLYDLKDLLCDKIEEVVKKNDISPSEMDSVYKATKTIYYITTIDAMENPEEFMDYSRDSYNSYARGGNSYARGGGNSNARRSNMYSRDGRMGMDGDGDGRYSERSYRMSREGNSGYSGHTREQMMQKIADMQRELEQMN